MGSPPARLRDPPRLGRLGARSRPRAGEAQAQAPQGQQFSEAGSAGACSNSRMVGENVDPGQFLSVFKRVWGLPFED